MRRIMRAVAMCMLVSWAAWGQGVPPDPRQVEVSNTVEAQVRFTGQTQDVSVTGTVALDTPSLEELNEPECPPLSMGRTGVDGTVRTVPVSADADRTKLLVVNHSNSGYLSCRTGPSVGFTSPVCTLAAAGGTREGARLDPGASATFDIIETTLLRCINCANDGTNSANTAQVSYMELSCI